MSSEKVAGEGTPSEDPVSFEVRWGDSDRLQTVYANNLHVSHSDAQFHLVFGELTAPLSLDFRKETRSVQRLEIRPVVRVAVSPGVMASFVKAINENFERFKAAQAAKSRGER